MFYFWANGWVFFFLLLHLHILSNFFLLSLSIHSVPYNLPWQLKLRLAIIFFFYSQVFWIILYISKYVNYAIRIQKEVNRFGMSYLINFLGTVLIIAINRMMKCTKDIDSNSNLGFPRLVKDHQNFLKSADKRQRYIKSTLFLPNSHEIIKK